MESILSVVGDREIIKAINERIEEGVSEKDDPRPSLQSSPLNCPAGTIGAVWGAPVILKLVVVIGPPLIAFATALVPLLREIRKTKPESAPPIVINLSYRDGAQVAVDADSSVEEVCKQLTAVR